MTNEAAERLRDMLAKAGWGGPPYLVDMLDEALADERRAGANEERERMRAMRRDFQNLPHAEFPIKWPDWRDYEEVLPTYCGCQECRMWRSGS